MAYKCHARWIHDLGQGLDRWRADLARELVRGGGRVRGCRALIAIAAIVFLPGRNRARRSLTMRLTGRAEVAFGNDRWNLDWSRTRDVLVGRCCYMGNSESQHRERFSVNTDRLAPKGEFAARSNGIHSIARRRVSDAINRQWRPRASWCVPRRREGASDRADPPVCRAGRAPTQPACRTAPVAARPAAAWVRGA